MTDVVLLYDADCPNVEVARRNLLEACAAASVPARWKEHFLGDGSIPDAWRGFGSPTILIDGVDVAGEQPSGQGRSCRVYEDETGARSGAPSLEMLRGRLLEATRARPSLSPRVQARRLAGVVPAMGLGLLPVGLCPGCWPVYAGLASALGLGFVMETRFLLPATAAALVLALGALGFRAKQRRGFGPLALGLAAAVAVLVGKFMLDSQTILYTGLGTLVGASFWNAWPRPRSEPEPACPRCRTTDQHRQSPRVAS